MDQRAAMPSNARQHVGQALHPLAADRAQVDVGQPGLEQAARPQQRSGDLGEQQVAEIVPVEGAEDDGDGLHCRVGVLACRPRRVIRATD